MDKVNAALDNLNEYADRTIYNFGQMTQGIGRFTAAGVNLEDSVNTIKGLANVAAGAGTNAEALARTYIQVSQALQRGYFMLQDWNSLTNAQMGKVCWRSLRRDRDRPCYRKQSPTMSRSRRSYYRSTAKWQR